MLVLTLLGVDSILKSLDLSPLKTQLLWDNTLGFWLLCGVILVGIITAYKLRNHQKIRIQAWVGRISLALLGILTQFPRWARGVGYYLILSYTEELLKFTLAHNQTTKLDSNSISQLLASSILIAFAFGITELLLSIIILYRSDQELGKSILFGRGFISTWIHIISTGIIALIIMKKKQKNQILNFFIALGFGCIIHSSYNLSIHFHQGWIGILMSIGGFFALTYILYHIDELYLPTTP